MYDLLRAGTRRPNIFGYNNNSDNEYFLQPSERESRFINVEIGFAGFLISYATIMTAILIYFRILNASPKPVIILPEINNNSEFRGFPNQHLALIYSDGSIYDFPLQNQCQLSKKLIFKLPSDSNYFGYSDYASGTEDEI